MAKQKAMAEIASGADIGHSSMTTQKLSHLTPK